jgi:hypothetical protein
LYGRRSEDCNRKLALLWQRSNQRLKQPAGGSVEVN